MDPKCIPKRKKLEMEMDTEVPVRLFNVVLDI